jgi:hypothetical protein
MLPESLQETILDYPLNIHTISRQSQPDFVFEVGRSTLAFRFCLSPSTAYSSRWYYQYTRETWAIGRQTYVTDTCTFALCDVSLGLEQDVTIVVQLDRFAAEST